jgi:YspA, cpYpsA-related SLOG family
MRVLVCGGRDFGDAGLMISVLDRLHTEKFFTVLIHGNALRQPSLDVQG